MASETIRKESPRRRGWDRRRDFGRRIVRERRREALVVPFERRSGSDRRSGAQRRAHNERRTSPPEGTYRVDF